MPPKFQLEDILESTESVERPVGSQIRLEDILETGPVAVGGGGMFTSGPGGVPFVVEREELERGKGAKTVGRLALEAGSGVALAAAGPYLAGPALAVKLGRYGQTALRGIGAFIGEASGSLEAEFFDPSEHPIRRAFGTGLAGLFGEAVIGAKGVKALRGGTELEEGAEEAIEAIAKRGGVLLPGRASKHRGIDILETISEKSFTGGKAVGETLKESQRIARDLFDEFVDDFRRLGNREDIGELAQNVILDRGDAAKAMGKRMFGALDEVIDPSVKEVVNYQPLHKLAKEVLKENAAGLGDPKVSRLARRILTKPKFSVSFKEAQALRSDLLGIGRSGSDFIAGKGQAAGKRFAHVLDEEMEVAAKRLGVHGQWRGANKFWREDVHETFGSGIIKSLMKKEPEAVFQSIIRNQRPGTVRKVRELIKDDEVWGAVQGQFLVDAAAKHADSTGMINAKALTREFKKLGDDTLKEIFPEAADRVALKRVIRTMELTQKEIGEGIPGGMFIQLAQAGAMIKVGLAMTGGGTAGLGAAGVIVIGPALFAKLLTNPRTARWLTTGIKAKPGTEAAVRAFGQITALLAKEGIFTEQQAEAPRGPQTLLGGAAHLAGPVQ